MPATYCAKQRGRLVAVSRATPRAGQHLLQLHQSPFLFYCEHGLWAWTLLHGQGMVTSKPCYRSTVSAMEALWDRPRERSSRVLHKQMEHMEPPLSFQLLGREPSRLSTCSVKLVGGSTQRQQGFRHIAPPRNCGNTRVVFVFDSASREVLNVTHCKSPHVEGVLPDGFIIHPNEVPLITEVRQHLQASAIRESCPIHRGCPMHCTADLADGHAHL